MEYHVYIIFNDKHDKFYIGQSYNLEKRAIEHNLRLSKYTAKYDGIWEIVYDEIFPSRGEAMKREKFLKKQKNKNFYKKLCKINSVG